jgi:transcriptional regulator with GAF, ATPase, and Fis domain
MVAESKIPESEEGVPTLPLGEPASRGPWRVSVTPAEPGAGIGRAVTLGLGDTLIVGAHVACNLCIDDPTISARHVQLTGTADGVLVQDLASKNGLFIGGARVERAVLRGGDAQFSIGRTRVLVELLQSRGETSEAPLLPGLVGSSAPMRRLAADIQRVAVLDAPVLLLGESGTGKDVVARAIHSLSRRRGRFVPLNAGGLGEALADSELFGHCRGAFTGAVQARSGAFEQADRGTLFLDEVADLAPSIQVKLLRAVEDGEIRQLGGAAAVKVHTRLVTATWAPLEQRIEAGSFRADLFHRISTFVIRVPPLRQRRSDIPALARWLLRAREQELGPKYLSPGALDVLSGYDFPGNVRELFSIVYRAAALVPGREVSGADMTAALPATLASVGSGAARLDARQLLDVHHGNVSAAARSARVPRSTFRAWLRRQESASTPAAASAR